MPRKHNKEIQPSMDQLTKDFQHGDMAAFREALNPLIRIYGISDLALDSDFNRISLWRYMKGEQDIKLTNFAAMMKALGIRVRFETDPKTTKMLRFLKLQRLHGLHERYMQFEKEMAEIEGTYERTSSDGAES